MLLLRVSQLTLLLCFLTSVPKSAAILDCSAFTRNSSNLSVAAMSWAGRLSACFEANPYDTSQPPLLSSGLPHLSIGYDYSLVYEYLISFDQGAISLMGQLTISWTDA